MAKYIFFCFLFFCLFACQKLPHAQYDLGDSYVVVEEKVLADFSFQNQEGAVFQKKHLQGKWSLLFFGYTHCPDICFPTLHELKKMYQQLEQILPSKKLPQIIFVTVDPDRDSPAVLSRYIKNFHPAFQAIVSAEQQTIALAKQLGIFYYKHEIQEANKHLHKKEQFSKNYTINHNGAILLLNDKANLVGIFSTPHRAHQMANTLEQIL